jgi:hypothetical protein
VIKVTAIREADDPIALRASIGGTPEVGFYLVFRGDPEAVRNMLRVVNAVAQVPGTLEQA